MDVITSSNVIVFPIKILVLEVSDVKIYVAVLYWYSIPKIKQEAMVADFIQYNTYMLDSLFSSSYFVDQIHIQNN